MYMVTSRGAARATAFFSSTIEVATAFGCEQAILYEIRYCIQHGFAIAGDVAADEFEEGVQIECGAFELVEGGEDAPRDGVHRVPYAGLLSHKNQINRCPVPQNGTIRYKFNRKAKGARRTNFRRDGDHKLATRA